MNFTFQIEWNLHIENEAEARPLALSQKKQYVLREEQSVKEKELVSSLIKATTQGLSLPKVNLLLLLHGYACMYMCHFSVNNFMFSHTHVFTRLLINILCMSDQQK